MRRVLSELPNAPITFVARVTPAATHYTQTALPELLPQFFARLQIAEQDSAVAAQENVAALHVAVSEHFSALQEVQGVENLDWERT